MVTFTPIGGGQPQDLSDQVLPQGSANDDNIFRFETEASTWIYNSGTELFEAAGTYEVTVAPGDDDYAIETCMQTFTRSE